ncbi:pyrroloquinoline quinone biosynthesis protein PqqD [Paraburkholderia ginsengiterrae]|uniref:Pyrroloquinoline quinone biosynthesis protein PqqD n=1 Tax=Paraburkholderia ginsengiterrae TaxID=1462993 RepID=A0A1A9MYC6_9BURK|nr:pyrroloquinoline quinone biosynthesis peptide chaperone PqqD [Paraburkholderia ginsengiterrae]OAJ53517.1 pyrroloquinoline quinone biosynthesis protein PqqD [Paraburkholderia ginsengiterrae]OAJ59069.1 pyrroloquinoline quinone biosynthesis protein PqqD [Paraburkholderia ginsengiterrae]
MNAPRHDHHASARPHLRMMFRLQWETAQDAYVLLYPEGMVKLNPSAGEILARCDGTREMDDIIEELEDLFNTSDLAADVYRFIDHARQRGWLD